MRGDWDGAAMNLILCRLTLELVIECDADTSKDNIKEMAEHFAVEEIDRVEFDSSRVVTSLFSLPPDWRDSLPYRDPNVGPELTCRQILSNKGEP
jgi:hypothetical protein